MGNRPPNLATAAAVNGAAVAVTMVTASGRRFSGDWWKDNEQGVAAQRAEQQRITDYYAHLAQQQEDRENAEARERFAASQRRNNV